MPLASNIRYNGYTHRYPAKTVRVIPDVPRSGSSPGVPMVGIRHYVNYKTYRGLYPTHPFDTVCIRKRRERQVVWRDEVSVDVRRRRGGGVGHHSFLGVIKVATTASATTLCKYNSGRKDDRNDGMLNPVPASGVACHDFPNLKDSGISVLKCNYVH